MIFEIAKKPLLVIATLCLFLTLSGCITSNHIQQKSKRTYFSHSIHNSTRPDRFERLQTSDSVKSFEVTEGVEIVLHFDNDSATVRREDIERLQSFLLNFTSNEMPVFLITGHTDNNNSDLYNISLSDRRAKSTQAQMLRMGVPITQTALRGLGESAPVATNESVDGRQSNRRVTVSAIN